MRLAVLDAFFYLRHGLLNDLAKVSTNLSLPRLIYFFQVFGDRLCHNKNSFITGAMVAGSTLCSWPSMRRYCPLGKIPARVWAVLRIHSQLPPPAITRVGALTEAARSAGKE